MKLLRRTDDTDLLQARLGARLAGGLNLSSATMSHEVTERLRVAREQAEARGRSMRATRGHASRQRATSAVSTDAAPWWLRVAAVMPLMVLVVGLVVIDEWAAREQVLAAADFDAQLLADDLPPAAYSDPGFGEYIRSSPTP